MQYLGYIAFRFLVFLFWLLPFRVLYWLSDGLSFLFYRFGYRKAVVFGNLKRCFPKKNEAELHRIARESYRNLTDIILEGIKSMSMSLPEIHRRYTYYGFEKLNTILEGGQSVIICGSHYCNWEWGVITAPSCFVRSTYGVYKPLKNKPINDFFNRSRARENMNLIAMRETFAKMEAEQDQAAVYFLIADQSPSNRKRAQWVDFFNQETPCLPGPDVLSRKYDYPVFHFESNRIKRGFYRLDFTEVCLQPKAVPETGVTQRYMAILEKAIRKQPENWLWSHKRWKYTRETVNK